MTVSPADDERYVTAEEFLSAEPDAWSETSGDLEIVDGRLVRLMAQSDAHSRVVRRLAAAIEGARDSKGPCLRVSSDVAVRFPDTEETRADRRLNVRYPDIFVRDCEPYDVNTVRDHIHLVVEVISKDTGDTDTGLKRVLYARAGIPAYLIVYFDKTWESIDRIEEYRLDWSGLRYEPHHTHRTALVLDTPVTLAVTFETLQTP
ncbi:Uma2 family endonuclease [Nocardia huaxiensis]|uniref:Uma2 family endonuclease n=1 Tax=Nocardia huaxiensis TaxID=2755382 RepID=UPI001E512E1B|nr:Uma2 family endonuclease [Nocardia huaxiensis]UFS96399.1 Uma2 family endonuclease [Nocardia huaxiensis]